ncbi:MAG: hypothetical protein MJH10_15450 [Epibacterium sp.]|nr:hypothetical protein [Epibacterium sp.]NQX74914.1 hypothetical protein [Epibacterium sp.]
MSNVTQLHRQNLYRFTVSVSDVYTVNVPGHTESSAIETLNDLIHDVPVFEQIHSSMTRMDHKILESNLISSGDNWDTIEH